MFKRGDICYIVENNSKVSPVKIVRKQGQLYTVQLIGTCGAIRIPEHRLFETQTEAEMSIKPLEPVKGVQPVVRHGNYKKG